MNQKEKQLNSTERLKSQGACIDLRRVFSILIILDQGLKRGAQTYQMYLRQEVHCTVVRQRVIRRKSQHPDMWAVLMTRLHVHYWRSDPRRSPPLYAKSERQPARTVKVTYCGKS